MLQQWTLCVQIHMSIEKQSPDSEGRWCWSIIHCGNTELRQLILSQDTNLNHSHFWPVWQIVLPHPAAVWCQGKLNFLTTSFKHPLRKMALNITP